MRLWHPERIAAIVSQNGNMYEEGLGKKWEARKAYWKNPTPELRQQFSSAFALETIIGQYTFGTPERSVGPDGYSLDFYYVNLPGCAEMQNDLILDYRTNVALYPEFQKYLRDNQPPLMAVWGKNDPSFIPAGAEAFKRDLSNAEIHFVPSGHFALESHHTEITATVIGKRENIMCQTCFLVHSRAIHFQDLLHALLRQSSFLGLSAKSTQLVFNERTFFTISTFSLDSLIVCSSKCAEIIVHRGIFKLILTHPCFKLIAETNIYGIKKKVQLLTVKVMQGGTQIQVGIAITNLTIIP